MSFASITIPARRLDAALYVLGSFCARTDVPPKLAYTMGRNLSNLRSEAQRVAEARDELLARFAAKGEDGRPKTRTVKQDGQSYTTYEWIDAEAEREASEASRDLAGTDVEVRVRRVPLADFDALGSVTPALFDACDFLVDDTASSCAVS